MHFDCVGINLHKLYEGINRLVGFVAEEQIYALVKRLGFTLIVLLFFNIERAGVPSGCKQHRDKN
jgi:hypothetical protein